MLLTLRCAVGDSSSKLVLELLRKGVLLCFSSFLLIEGILRQKLAQVNVQKHPHGALGPVSTPIDPFALGNASNATAIHGTGNAYYQMFSWVMLIPMTGIFLVACAAVAECQRRQRDGTLACDSAKLRDVERMSRWNWLGLEPE